MSMNSKKNTYFLSLLLFLSYSLPWFYSFYVGDSIYVNAWDEETYLTKAMALATQYSVGYWFSSFVTLLFQSLGISGVIQNFIFDIVLTPLTLWFCYRTIRLFGQERVYALIFSVVILFSSILTNYANPLVQLIQPWMESRNIPLFMPGLESYISALRTPEPQLSYLLISIFTFLFVKYKKIWILIIPIPFLYHFVALSYFSFVCIVFLIRLVNNKTLLFISSFFIPLAFSMLCILLDSYLKSTMGTGVYSLFPSHTVNYTRNINIPFELVIMVFISCIYTLLSDKKRKIVALDKLLILIPIQVLFLANMQVLTGFTISFKNFHDYIFPIYLGLYLVSFLMLLFSTAKKLLSFFIFSIVLLLSFNVYLYHSIIRLPTNTVFGTVLSPSALSQAKKFPECVVILDMNLAAKMSYRFANQPNALFSYQSHFQKHNLENHERALNAISTQLNEGERFTLKSGISVLKENVNRAPNADGDVCKSEYSFVRPLSRD